VERIKVNDPIVVEKTGSAVISVDLILQALKLIRNYLETWNCGYFWMFFFGYDSFDSLTIRGLLSHT
jgi:hypothetical protein